jgi:putative ABC transport system permease protein
VALSLMLLVGAGLFVGTLRNLLSVDAGFHPRNVLLVSADVQQAAIPIAQRIRTYREILERLRALPGVVSAASSLITPISGRGWNGRIFVEGYVPQSRNDRLIFFNRVSPGYFQTMRTALLTGRDFDDRDVLNSEKVMVIDESISRKFFGSASPIGKTVGIQGGPGKPEIYRVIGVVRDAKYAKIDEATRRTAYVVIGQDPKPEPWVNYEIRSNGPIEALIPSIRTAFSEVNGDISLVFRNLETQVSESLSQQRIVALLASVFGLLALLLATVGLYGVTAYAVARRRAEIGIRMALGAQRWSVVWLVLRGVVGWLALGVLLGIAASLVAGRLIASLLYGIQPNDPVQLIGAAIGLASVAAIAAYLPARRAARIDPMTALREQ